MDVYKKLPIELQDLVREKLLEEYRREHQSKFEETLSELLQKNKELANLISQLKGIGGDKPTDVKPPSKRKTSKKLSLDSESLMILKN